MLPKGLYEAMPLLYMLCGALAILSIGGVVTPLGTVLYLFGAWVWGLRSSRRRRSAAVRQRPSGRPLWNATLYELLPFLYILCGLFLLDLLQHEIRYVSGPLMIGTGLMLILVRASERRKATRVVPAPSLDPVDRMIATSQQYGTGMALARGVADDIAAKTQQIPVFTPAQRRCEQCAVRDLCAGVTLKEETISEIMRLSQTISPDQSYELFRAAVERIERQPVEDRELLPVLRKLHAYATLCATWRSTGRHA